MKYNRLERFSELNLQHMSETYLNSLLDIKDVEPKRPSGYENPLHPCALHTCGLPLYEVQS